MENHKLLTLRVALKQVGTYSDFWVKSYYGNKNYYNSKIAVFEA